MILPLIILIHYKLKFYLILISKRNGQNYSYIRGKYFMSRTKIPEKTITEILLKCARHCVLCGKNCGTNIEIHHIVPIKEGGTNDFDNLIPLCFDCHANVAHYNSAHPKGRKYEINELKIIPNHFYENQEALNIKNKKQNNDRREIINDFKIIASIIKDNLYTPDIRFNFISDVDDLWRKYEMDPFFKDSDLLDSLNTIAYILALTQYDEPLKKEVYEQIEPYARKFLTEYYRLFY